MKFWTSLITEAVIYTAALFLAHAFWLNSEVIEPAMAQRKRGAYIAGFVYYSVSIAIALFITRKLNI